MDISGKIMTVTGPISPDQLGQTLMHEHLFIDATSYFEMPKEETLKKKALEPVKMSNLGWIRADITRNKDSLVLNDDETAMDEVLEYKAVGGCSIVDVTTRDIGQDPQALRRLSVRTGVNIIAGCGYYLMGTYPSELKSRSTESIAQDMINDLTKGIGNTQVRAGIIGEIGCSNPWDETEKKVMKAAALAHSKTGATIQIHPGRDKQSPFEILDFLDEEGVDLKRVIMGHIERTIPQIEGLKKLIKRGCFIEYDLFGFEMYYSFFPTFFDLPNDDGRLNQIKQLVDDGYLDKILISQDIAIKIRLIKYGGYGYGHILNNIVPRMRLRGLTDTQIDQLLIQNPMHLLTFPDR